MKYQRTFPPKPLLLQEERHRLEYLESLNYEEEITEKILISNSLEFEDTEDDPTEVDESEEDTKIFNLLNQKAIDFLWKEEE